MKILNSRKLLPAYSEGSEIPPLGISIQANGNRFVSHLGSFERAWIAAEDLNFTPIGEATLNPFAIAQTFCTPERPIPIQKVKKGVLVQLDRCPARKWPIRFDLTGFANEAIEVGFQRNGRIFSMLPIDLTPGWATRSKMALDRISSSKIIFFDFIFGGSCCFMVSICLRLAYLFDTIPYYCAVFLAEAAITLVTLLGYMVARHTKNGALLGKSVLYFFISLLWLWAWLSAKV